MMERPQSGLQTLDNIAAAADLLSSLERTGSECSVQELTGHCFLFLLRGKVQPGGICSSVCRHRESFSLNRIHRGRPDEWSRVVIALEKRRQEHAVDRGEAGGPLPRNPQEFRKPLKSRAFPSMSFRE